jgi:PadR family transcriptional regulator PadR
MLGNFKKKLKKYSLLPCIIRYCMIQCYRTLKGTVKGVLELCVLSMLEREVCYGYELVNEISKSISISEGTIYPLLRRLKSEELVTTYLQESQEGPPRKYYKLTELGQKKEEELKEEWFTFVKDVNNFLKGSGKNE